jgi:hypothetical protein
MALQSLRDCDMENDLVKLGIVALNIGMIDEALTFEKHSKRVGKM